MGTRYIDLKGSLQSPEADSSCVTWPCKEQKQNLTFLKNIYSCLMDWEPGPALRMFSATFFHYYFLLAHNLCHNKLIIFSKPHTGPFVLPKLLFGTQYWQKWCKCNSKVLELQLSNKYDIWKGVSRNKGESSNTRLGMMPFFFKTTPTTFLKRWKQSLPTWQILVIKNYFPAYYGDYEVNYPKVIGFNLSPRWSFNLENALAVAKILHYTSNQKKKEFLLLVCFRCIRFKNSQQPFNND